MEKDLVLNMENMFYSTVSQIHSYHQIKNNLQWYEKINPIIHHKMKMIRIKIIEQIDAIIMNYKTIDKRFIKDFQIIYMINMDYINHLSYIDLTCKFIDHNTLNQNIFRQMIFQNRYIIDIISDNITIRDTLENIAYEGKDQVPNNIEWLEKAIKSIKECILYYFMDFIDKK